MLLAITPLEQQKSQAFVKSAINLSEIGQANMRSNHDREINCQKCGDVTLNRLKYCKPCAEIVKAEQVKANNAEIRKLSGMAKEVIVKKVKIIYNELIFDCGNAPEID